MEDPDPEQDPDLDKKLIISDQDTDLWGQIISDPGRSGTLKKGHDYVDINLNFYWL